MTTDPVLIAYTAKRTKSDRTAWTRIGQAFPHETGAGLTVVLDSIPLDGRIILLELDERDHERLAAGRGRRSPKPQTKASAPVLRSDLFKSDGK